MANVAITHLLPLHCLIQDLKQAEIVWDPGLPGSCSDLQNTHISCTTVRNIAQFQFSVGILADQGNPSRVGSLLAPTGPS